MCLPSAPAVDNSAAEAARAAQVKREADIRSGREAIDKAFVGFDDSYYQGIERAAQAFYNPDLEDQYTRARKAAVMSLGRTSNLQSSAGAQSLADLFEQYQRAKVTVADRARGYAQGARGDIERTRSDLNSQLVASADPAQAGSAALNQAALFGAPPSFDPLGDVFQKFTAGLVNQRVADDRAVSPSGARLFGLSTRGTGRTIS